jgi:hypothetical protein
MLSVGLWRWYINITITILDIIHRPVFYLHLLRFLWGTDKPVELSSVEFQIKDRTIDNAPNCDSYINITTSQTYG